MKYDNIISKSINWIAQNRNQFSITQFKLFVDKLTFFKPFGELVLTMSFLKFLKKNRLVDELLTWAWEETQNGDVILKILLTRPDLIVISSIYADFYSNGFTNPKIDSILRHYSKDPYKFSGELPIWRVMDIEHSFEKLKLKKFNANLQQATWLYKNAEPWIINDDLAYSITHEIFYITDFGRNSKRLHRKIYSYLKYWLPYWIDIYVEQQNWDIVAEMIMASRCINSNENLDFAHQSLAKAQLPNGIFPSPEEGGKNLIKEKDNCERKTFLKNYHTTLVGLMSYSM